MIEDEKAEKRRQHAQREAERRRNETREQREIRLAKAKARYVKNRKARIAYTMEWRRRNLEHAKAGQRRRYLANANSISRERVRRFGISPEAFDAINAAQDGLCAICRKPPVKQRRLAVDHDHKTGAVRGLLCGKCNPALGLFGDDVATLYAAIAYLNR